MMLFGHMSAAEADAKWLEITSRTEALDGGSIERSESVESLQKLAS